MTASMMMGFLAATTAIAPPTYSDWHVGEELGEAVCHATDVDFSDAQNGFATCVGGKVMVTKDGGRQWVVFGSPFVQNMVYAHAENSTTFFAARSGLYRTTDLGDTWSEVGNLSTQPGDIADAYFGSNGHRVVVQSGAIRYSDDEGVTWAVGYPAEVGVYLDELDFVDDQIGYASGGVVFANGSLGSLLRTTDGGKNWTQLPFDLGRIQTLAFSDADNGVVSTQDASLYVTDDAGSNWIRIGSTPGQRLLVDFAQRDEAHWFALGDDGCIVETSDAGIHWDVGYCDMLRNFTALDLSGGRVVAVGNDGLVISEERIFRDGMECGRCDVE